MGSRHGKPKYRCCARVRRPRSRLCLRKGCGRKYQPLSQRKAEFYRGLVNALTYFGGSPRHLIFGNLKAAVLNGSGRSACLHPEFLALCGYFCLQPVACERRDPESNGVVEAGVRYVKHNALAGRADELLRFEDYLALAPRWRDEVANLRRHMKAPTNDHWTASSRSVLCCAHCRRFRSTPMRSFRPSSVRMHGSSSTAIGCPVRRGQHIGHGLDRQVDASRGGAFHPRRQLSHERQADRLAQRLTPWGAESRRTTAHRGGARHSAVVSERVVVAPDAQPTLEHSRASSGVLQRPVRSSASSIRPQALVQFRKRLTTSFDFAIWPSCRGPGKPLRVNWRWSPSTTQHARERRMTHRQYRAAPHQAPSRSRILTPRPEPRAEQHLCTRRNIHASLPPPPTGSAFAIETGSDFLIGPSFVVFELPREYVLRVPAGISRRRGRNEWQQTCS